MAISGVVLGITSTSAYAVDLKCEKDVRGKRDFIVSVDLNAPTVNHTEKDIVQTVKLFLSPDYITYTVINVDDDKMQTKYVISRKDLTLQASMGHRLSGSMTDLFDYGSCEKIKIDRML